MLLATHNQTINNSWLIYHVIIPHHHDKPVTRLFTTSPCLLRLTYQEVCNYSQSYRCVSRRQVLPSQFGGMLVIVRPLMKANLTSLRLSVAGTPTCAGGVIASFLLHYVYNNTNVWFDLKTLIVLLKKFQENLIKFPDLEFNFTLGIHIYILTSRNFRNVVDL